MTIRTTFFLMTVILLSACGGVEPERFLLGEGSFPTTAVDPSTGDVYWSWFGEENGRNAVFVARLPAESDRPEPAVNVSRDHAGVNPHQQAPAQLSVAPDGTLYVVWSTRLETPGRRFPASNLVLARSPDGGRTFDRPVFVNADHNGPPAGHTFQDMAVGPDGAVYVSWLDSREESDDTAHHGNHQSSQTDVRVARSTDGGKTFAASVIVARGTCQCCRTSLVVDGGSVFVAWRHVFGANVRDIAVARSVDGGRTFSEPVRVHEDGWAIDGCPHAGPSLELDHEGTLHAAWYTAAEGIEGLYYAVSIDTGKTFGTAEPIARGLPVATARLSIGTDEMKLAWEDPRSRDVHLGTPGRAEQARSLRGEHPALDAGADVVSLTWTNEGIVEAHVAR